MWLTTPGASVDRNVDVVTDAQPSGVVSCIDLVRSDAMAYLPSSPSPSRAFGEVMGIKWSTGEWDQLECKVRQDDYGQHTTG